MTQQPPSGIIFDVDGTLIDSVDLHAEAWQEALREFGHVIAFEDIRRQIGKGGDQLTPVFLDRSEVDRIGEKLERFRTQVYHRKYLPLAHAFPCVRSLSQRITDAGQRIALASSAKTDELAIYKKMAQIEDLVSADTSADDAERSKPDPDIFEAALGRLSVPTSRALVVGDTPYDAEAAAKIGLRSIGVLCGGFPRQNLGRRLHRHLPRPGGPAAQLCTLTAGRNRGAGRSRLRQRRMPDIVAEATDVESGSPRFEGSERDKALAHAPLRPRLIHEIIREEGEAELRRPASALAWSGLASGLSMGFSFLTQCLLRSSLPDEPWRHLIGSFGYSVGFIIVVLGRQQLFTESTLTAVLPVLTRRDRRTAVATLRLWSIVLSANLIGTFAFAGVITLDGLFRPEVYSSLAEIAAKTMEASFALTLLKAIFAGWLIALMVWLLPSAGSARMLVILLLTYIVALGGFSHIIAGSVEAAYAVFTGHASIGDYLGAFLIPTLLGNTIGGVSLVAFLNHAPLTSELEIPAGAAE